MRPRFQHWFPLAVAVIGLASSGIHAQKGPALPDVLPAVAPTSIAVNPFGGNVYVANGVSNFVYAYSPTGSLVWTSPDLGGPAYRVAAPRGIAGSITPLSALKYRSRQSGNWNDFTTWEVDAGGGFVNAVSGETPTSANDTITIQNPHTVTVSASVNADQLTVNSGGKLIVSSGQTLTIDDGAGNDLTIVGDTTVDAGATLATAGVVTGPAIFRVSGTLQLNNGGSMGAQPIYFGSSTLVYNTSSGFSVGNEWANDSTIAGVGVPQDVTIIAGPSGTVQMPTATAGLAGNLTISSGTLALSTISGANLNVGGNWSNSGALTTNGRTVTFNGNAAQSIGGSSTTSFSNFTDSNTSAAVTFNTNFNVSGTFNMNGAGTLFTPGSSSVQINSAGSTGTISGTGRVQVTRLSANPFSSQYRFSTFSVTALTGEWAGAGDQGIENGVAGYGGIMTSGSGTKTIGGGGTLAINGDVTIGSGTTLAQGGNSLNVAGNWSNSGTFTPGTSAVRVTFNGAGNTQTISGTNTFSNLTINHTGANSVTAAGSTLAVTGLLRVQSGTFTSATSYVDVTIDAAGTLALSGPITVSGNWTNNGGTFTPGTNGVSFNGATGQTITGDTSFYDFTKSVAAAQQFNFTAGSTTTVTHSLTLTGASGQLLTLRSTGSPAQWKLNAPTTQSVSYVDVKDSDASGGSSIAPTNSTDSGHNINWLFPPTLGTYPDTTVALSADATVTPGAAPTDATSINVSSSTNFKGTFSANPTTGVVRVTDAHPAGTHTVTVRAFNGSAVNTTKTFTLTVQTGTACAGASIFTNAADSSVGSYPMSVAIGDFNNDGKQDIAVANSDSNTVSIRLGDGSGGFSGTTDVSVGTYPMSVAIGDFNGDGKQDFAAANYFSNAVVSIRLGDGLGGFTSTTNVSVGTNPDSVAIGDFNNDGKQDIAVANNSSATVSIRLGDGAGGFSGTTNVSVGANPYSVAIGDFNNDGKQDIAAANHSSDTVSIRLGDGAGGFSGTTNVSVGSDPYSVAIGDFNNDGKQDIAAANQDSNTVSIRLGDGLGGFSGTTEISVGSSPRSVAIGDFNNDGKQDLATANFSSNTVSIRLGDGLGGFSGTTDVSVGSNPYGVAIGDFNNDGTQDIAAANTGSSTVSIRLGQCNLPPTIAAATGLSRQQGSPSSNSTIATVNDTESGAGGVTVTVNGGASSTVNGVTISNIVNTAGTVTADVVAACGATNASFTLQASDGSSTATDTLTVTVTANTAPTLVYSSPQSVAFGGALNVTPNAASDNGAITYAVQAGHGLTTAPTVDASGVVSITNAQPAGTHTITVRATDNCGLTTDATFTLEVQPQPPTLGTYPNTTVALGANATVTPDAAPTNATSINVSSSTNFKGTFSADPATGVVRVTNAHPAGTYAVTVTAFNGPVVNTTKTFTLTVQTGTACTGVSLFTNAADSSVGSNPFSVAIGDFNNDGKQDIAVANIGSNTVSIRLGDGAGGFSGTTNVSVGSGPWSVAIGDFNNDGKQDIAAANSSSNTVSIRLGDGAGGFSGTTEVSVGSSPRSVAIGDFNNDGKQDIAAANRDSNTVSIRLGDGAGGFTGTTNVSVGTEPRSVAIGDFNNDGKQDIAAANIGSNTVSIRLGDGSGGFTGTTEVSVGSLPVSVAIGDFNNDGKQDFVVTNWLSATVSIRLGDGFGGFSATTDVSVGSRPQSVAIGDFNNDGKQDIAVANENSNTVSMRLGDGAGGFSGTTNVSVGTNPQSVAIGDFNNDGKQDFGAANNSSNSVSIRLGQCNPAPTIAAATGLSRQQGSPASNSQIATVTDDGGNGSVNVTVTSANPSNGVTISNIVNTGGNITANIVADCTATTATFTLQASDGSSTATDTLTVTVTANTAPALVYSSPQSVAFAGSLNVTPTTASDNGSITGYAVQTGHGLTTAPTVDASGVVSITNAQPAGTHTITVRATDNCGLTTDATFTLEVQPQPPTLGTYPNTTVALGANATVTPDAAPTNATSINVSSSTNFKGTFSADPATGVVRVTNAHPAGTYAVTVTAFNGSVSVTRTFTLTVQAGTACTGVSQFTNAADSTVGSTPRSVAIGDFNGDGKQDIAVANEGSTTVSIRLGDGAGGFAGTTNVSVGTQPISVAIGDFNNDGKQDIAVANSLSNTVSIRLGDGTGGFTGSTEVSVGSDPYSVVIGDFNNDGKQDIAVANSLSNTVSIRLGDGLGGFSGTTEVSVGSNPQSVAIGDFNGDGKQDIAVANLSSNTVSIRLGDGAGGFTGSTEVSVGSDPYSVAIGDFNNDGKQDIATANVGSNTVSIRLGDGAGGFIGTTNVSVGTAPRSVAIGDFNNDGNQDIATANRDSNTVSIRLGDGAGGFTGTTNVSVGTAPQSVAIGDFNGDGKQDIAGANSSLNNVSIRLGQCNFPPTIAAATGLSRQQGSSTSNSQIATVTDDGGNGSVNVTVTSANPSNGVTISNIVNTGGNITANIVADCTATTATFTLQASDGSSTATDTLTVTVTANTAPTLVYSSPQSVAFGGALNVTPNAASDNGTITYAVQAGHGLTTAPTVNSSGVVSITNAQSAGTHTITIRATDNCGAFTDAAFTLNVGAMPTFAIDDVTHHEGNAGTTSYIFTVTKNGSTALNSSVNFTTVDGTATTANNDYQAQSGSLTFLPTDTTKTITVLVNGDTTFEANEAFTVHLSGASSATTSDADGTGTITNDDGGVLRIDTVTPAAGRASGGQQIILTGAFAGLSTVTMGGASASWSYTNGGGDTSAITVTTPAHSVGAVQIDLTPTSGTGYSKPNAFAYLPTVFTDDALVIGVTTAKAQHIIELRQAVDAMRAVAGLSGAPWTDPALAASDTIKAIHILDLRTYLDDAATRLGYSTSPYTDPSLSTGYLIKRIHIEELRQRIRVIAG